jgi:hypothetical protein
MSYHMLSEIELEQILHHAFLEGWYSRQNKTDFSKDSCGIQARDNYVDKTMKNFTKGKK